MGDGCTENADTLSNTLDPLTAEGLVSFGD